MSTMLKINHAIRMDCKISFHYQKYTIQDRTQQVDRRRGAAYILSPYKLIINDGYYYLLAWDTQKNAVVTYRLDRMKGVELLTDHRDGYEEFSKLDMRSYTQQHFGMFSGEKKTVSIRFNNRLLDTMVDRFGTGAEVFYRPEDNSHFVVTTQIAISDQFYGWLLGFGKKVKMLYPADEVDKFKAYIDKIRDAYQ